MGYRRTHLAAANAAVANYIVTSCDMADGNYTLAKQDMPTEGARHVSVTRTVTNTGDTVGKIKIYGHDLLGRPQNEEITPGATGVPVLSTKWYTGLTQATQSGHTTAGASADTIVIGVGADIIVAEGSGTLERVIVNTTAAGAITLADENGTIGVLKSNVAEGFYTYEVEYSGYLKVTLAAASDVTIVHSPA
jgi:hypothetical protein